jgi:hypothetical protein
MYRTHVHVVHKMTAAKYTYARLGPTSHLPSPETWAPLSRTRVEYVNASSREPGFKRQGRPGLAGVPSHQRESLRKRTNASLSCRSRIALSSQSIRRSAANGCGRADGRTIIGGKWRRRGTVPCNLLFR